MYHTGRSERLSSENTALGERDRHVAGHDDVIQKAYADKIQGLAQSSSDELICAARLTCPAGMAVRADDCSGVELERFAAHFAGMHARAIDGAAETP